MFFRRMRGVAPGQVAVDLLLDDALGEVGSGGADVIGVLDFLINIAGHGRGVGILVIELLRQQFIRAGVLGALHNVIDVGAVIHGVKRVAVIDEGEQGFLNFGIQTAVLLLHLGGEILLGAAEGFATADAGEQMLPEEVAEKVRGGQLGVQCAVSNRRGADEYAGGFADEVQAHAVLLRALRGLRAVAAFREDDLRGVLDVDDVADLQRDGNVRTGGGVIGFLLPVPIRLSLDAVQVEVSEVAAVEA